MSTTRKKSLNPCHPSQTPSLTSWARPSLWAPSASERASGGPLVVCCHTHLNVPNTNTSMSRRAVMGKTCREKLLRVTFCYINLQMSLSAGGMKDLRACVCVMRVWVRLRLRDSVIYPEMEKKKEETYRPGGLFPRGAARELGPALQAPRSRQRIVVPRTVTLGWVFAVCIGSARNAALCRPSQAKKKKKRCRRRGGEVCGTVLEVEKLNPGRHSVLPSAPPPPAVPNCHPRTGPLLCPPNILPHT